MKEGFGKGFSRKGKSLKRVGPFSPFSEPPDFEN